MTNLRSGADRLQGRIIVVMVLDWFCLLYLLLVNHSDEHIGSGRKGYLSRLGSPIKS